jgi:hypothetical protein
VVLMRSRDERGVVTVFAAVFVSVVALVLASMVVDVGSAKAQRRQAQATADASALAGVNQVVALYRAQQDPKSTASRASILLVVKRYAAANWGTTDAEWAACSTSLPSAGYEDVVATDTTNCVLVNWTQKRLRVRIPPRAQTKWFGARSLTTGATAEASWSQQQPPCGLCVLGQGMTHSINNGNVLVSNANVQINGSLTTNVNNGSLDVTGGNLSVQTSATGSISPAPTITNVAITDPLSAFEVPTLPTNKPAGQNPCTGGPGVYGAFSTFNSCALTPGVYVITGLWKMASSGESLSGTGVTLYFTCKDGSGNPRECNSGESGGEFQQNGGTLQLSAPTSGSWAGSMIMYSRNNTANLTLRGNGATSYHGTIYAKSSTLDINGTTGAAAVDSLVVVNSLNLGGNNGYVSLVYNQPSNQSTVGGTYLDD